MSFAKTLNNIKINSEGKKVVFVSGNFNVVHPGHIRFLKFASTLGEYLVVGINNKNSHGAIIKEELRLDSIESLKIVNSTLIINSLEELLNQLKPDIVVKGSEHSKKTNVETEIIEKYGGKLIFYSGTVTFSSSDFLKRELENIKDKNISHPIQFIKRHKIRPKTLKDNLSKWKNLKILVLGDLILDEYVECDPIGMSQEDPTLVVSPIQSNKYIGGAGIVAAHASCLGANVSFFSVSGKNPHKKFIDKKFSQYGVKTFIMNDETRDLSIKKRYRASGKTLLRVSQLSQHEINKEISNEIYKSLTSLLKETNLVIFSDFNYGCLPQHLVDRITKICLKEKIMMVADSQSSSQFGNISRFKSMELITPTEREARLSIQDFISGLVVLSDKLLKKSKAKNIITTLGSEGLLIHKNNLGKSIFTDKIPALNNNPKDVAGAGDSLLIVCAMSLAIGHNIWESTYLASIASACQVSRIGNLPLSIEDIKSELDNYIEE